MLGMSRSVRQKVIATAAVAVLLGGAAFAAVSATGQGSGHTRAGNRHAVHRVRPRDLQAAAAYLGVPSTQLERELGSKSLAQIASEHGGKSEQGLTEAILAARRARIAKVSAALPARVKAEVSRSGVTAPAAALRGHRALALFTAPGHLGAVAAGYLGIVPAQLRDRLKAGESLAQLAEAAAGKSKEGLIAALVAAKQQKLANALAGRNVAPSSAERRERRLRKRMNALAERKFAGSRKP